MPTLYPSQSLPFVQLCLGHYQIIIMPIVVNYASPNTQTFRSFFSKNVTFVLACRQILKFAPAYFFSFDVEC